MSRSNWISIVALGLVLTFASQGQAQDEQPQTEQTETGGEDQVSPFAVPIRIVESASEEEARQHIEEQASERERQDLLAQQGMNEATQRMAFHSLLQTIFVFVGTVLVAGTLYLMVKANTAAIRAVEEGENATRQATKANKITGQSLDHAKTVSRAELRAYLGLAINKPVESARGNVLYQITITNFGQTPAFDVIHENGMTFDKPGQEKMIYTTKVTVGNIMPTQDMYSVGEMTEVKWADFVSRMTPEDRGVELFFFGRYSYRDVFGRSQWMTYKCILDVAGKDPAKWNFRLCNEGNDVSKDDYEGL